MAVRTTRSASRAARRDEAVATGPLGALSHDELGVIVDGLADTLQPVVAVALSCTCLGLRTPLQQTLKVLRQRHARAVALLRKLDMSCADLCALEVLDWCEEDLTANDIATLGMILRTSALPGLREIRIIECSLGEKGMLALCEALDNGTVPSLRNLALEANKFGPAGAEALAAALRRGAFPNLQKLGLFRNRIGNKGLAALAAPLRELPALSLLGLSECAIGDEGVTALVTDLCKNDFKMLKQLWLSHNEISDAGVAKLVGAIGAGGLPSLQMHDDFLDANPASEAAYEAVHAAYCKARVVLTITSLTDGRHKIWFVQKEDKPLSLLMQVYCNHEDMTRESVQFLFDGKPIEDTDTPGCLGMKDGQQHVIQVVMLGLDPPPAST